VSLGGVLASVLIIAGVYGDVTRVKVLFNKKDTALIQFVDTTQAQRGTLSFLRRSRARCFVPPCIVLS